MMENELIERIKEAEKIIFEFIDYEECHFDHHGFCQTHMIMNDGKCLNTVAKNWLLKRK